VNGESCANVSQSITDMKKAILSLTLLSAVALTLMAAQEAAAPTSPSIAKDTRCFEMRIYTTAPGKLEALNARFRDHTTALFKKHGIENIAYWIPVDTDKGSDNKLIYVLAHKSREAAKASWAAFGADPEWKKVQRETEANGKIVEKVESIYMGATDYSALK
jgi:hypothetical protein